MLCDVCDLENYSETNPFVEARCPNPEKQSHAKLIVGGHMLCLMLPSSNVSGLPQISEGMGYATKAQWESWLGSDEAKELGIVALLD